MSLLENNSFIQTLTTIFHPHDEEYEKHHNDENMSDVLIAKGITMIILCTVSTCMGILPMQMAKCLKWNISNAENPRSTKIVSFLLGFGGGVLFCTMFLHLLPEVKEGLEHLTEKGKIPEFSFSLSEMLTCTGFFIMYLVEESIHSYLRKKKTHRKEFSKKDVSRSTNELVENGETLPNFISGHSHYNGHGHSHHLPVIIDEKHDFIISSLRGLLIILGLSVHELFEGLAIGLESSASYVWYMFAAVAAHKFVIAFCIGVELITYNTRRYLTIIYICTFAIVSPLGIAIGIFLVGGESAAASGILPVVLQGLASGTLLYVIFFEILQEHRNGFNQYLSILFGFILMFGLQLLTAHSHSHSHDDHAYMHDHNTEYHQENDQNHELDSHEHIYSNEMSERILTDKIYKMTESIADSVSNVLSSTIKIPTDVSFQINNNETVLHENRS